MVSHDSAGVAADGPGLADLPDDLLAIVARDLFATGDHVGFFGACRHFCTVGYASIRAVTLRSRAETAEEAAGEALEERGIPDSFLDRHRSLTATGAAMQRQLRSVLGFLGRAHGLQEVVLHPYGEVFDEVGDRPPRLDAVAPSTDALFYALLLPELRQLRLTAFCASGVAISVLRDPPLSAVPLRRLELRMIEADTAGGVVGPVLACHGKSLTALHLTELYRGPDAGLPDCDLGEWMVASGGMPLLEVLELFLRCFDAAAASAVARACPALTTLRVQSLVEDGVGAALGLPAALPHLSHLRWHMGNGEWEDLATELPRLLAGRALTHLEFRFGRLVRPPDPVLLRTLRACAALPETLHVSEDLDDHLLAQLVAATNNRSMIELRTFLAPSVTIDGVGHLDQLPALRRLSVTIRQADSLASSVDQWPLHRLTHLSLFRHAGGEGLVLALLRGLAASGCRATLVRLWTTGGELTEAEAGPPLTALVRLRSLRYEVGDVEGVGARLSRAQLGAAVDRMRAWLHRRLPAVGADVVGRYSWWSRA